MAPPIKLKPFDRSLLKIAAKSAVKAAKKCKSAAVAALLTEAESEAHAMEGYADEAVHFLDAPDGPDKDEVQLVHGHRAALRTGCLILIGELEDMEEDQTTVLIDADGITSTKRRADDFRRLESMLRGIEDPQAGLAMEPTTPNAPSPTDAPEAPTEPTSDEAQGPFDAPAVPSPLALMSGEPVELVVPSEHEIADAEFEVLDDDAPPTPAAAALALETETDLSDNDLSDETLDAIIDDDTPIGSRA